MKREYKDLVENMQVPAALSDRVLSAVREKTETAEKARRSLWRAAVCAACALLLVLGSVTLQPAESLPESGDKTAALAYRFGLTAYAADAGKLLSSANSGIVFHWVENCGHFRVTGEHIEMVAMSVDKGALWRAGTCFGSSVEESFDPAAVYGLAPLEGQEMETLDGATLTLTARFANGAEATERYSLTTENLRVSQNENGDSELVPALAGDPMAMGDFLYAAPETGCVWLRWPVEGSNTVSLSNRYGYRSAPGGQAGTFHAGIDIPAKAGTTITAAAGGTVTETGYDPTRGNYLILNHGNGMETVYAQCLSLSVEKGGAVAAGEPIAAVGSTGMSTGPHLHFEVRQNGEAQNPVAYFDSDVRATLKMG